MTEALYVIPVSRASAFCIGGFCIHMKAGSRTCFMPGRWFRSGWACTRAGSERVADPEEWPYAASRTAFERDVCDAPGA